MAYTWATFKNAVKALMTDNALSDDVAVTAIADYTRAKASKDLAGNGDLFALHWASYQQHRRNLLGWTVTLDAATLQARVRELLSDASLDDTVATLAVFEFVKSKIAETVDKNPDLGAAHHTKWMTLRNRLLGHTITLSAAALRTAVNKLLTVDGTRHGIAESDGFIDQMIAQAQKELASLGAWLDKTIAQAQIDLAGSGVVIDRWIVHGARELQHYIEFYRQQHETQYVATDVSEEGLASIGDMPAEGAMIQDAYYVMDLPDSPCTRIPVKQYPWSNRYDLVCGAPTMSGHEFYLAINPAGENFTVFPPILTGYYLSVFWDGIKTDFADGDTVPFDDVAAKAVADFVQSELHSRPGPQRDLTLAKVFRDRYENERLQALRDAKDKTRFRFTVPSPLLSAKCANGSCGTVADDDDDDDDDDDCLCASVIEGEGSPEGVVSAAPKRLYFDRDATPALWIKRTGTGNTGWFELVG